MKKLHHHHVRVVRGKADKVPCFRMKPSLPAIDIMGSKPIVGVRSLEEGPKKGVGFPMSTHRVVMDIYIYPAY